MWQKATPAARYEITARVCTTDRKAYYAGMAALPFSAAGSFMVEWEVPSSFNLAVANWHMLCQKCTTDESF